MSDSECQVCNGTGKVTYAIPGDSEPRPIGNGLTVQTMDGYGTRACECVGSLPAIYDRATWWETESVYRAEVFTPVSDKQISVNAEIEVPRNEYGRRCHRTIENCYYRPTIDFEVFGETAILFAEDARELAAALIAAADACDKADIPIEEPTHA